jgi:hypothetical protein
MHAESATSASGGTSWPRSLTDTITRPIQATDCGGPTSALHTTPHPFILGTNNHSLTILSHPAMETAGLVIGTLTLTALFETCMTCFDYIDTGRQYGKDYQRFAISMRSLELRMSRWWDVAGLQVNIARSMSEDAERHIKDLLGEIYSDLQDAQERAHKYDNPVMTGDDGSVRLETLADRFQRRANIRQKRTPLGKVIKWALRDQTKCKRLIRDIKNAIEELEGVLPQTALDSQLTHQAAVEDAQQLFVQPTEVEEPAEANATPVIEILHDATDNDPVLQRVLEIVAKQASSGDEIRNIFTSDKARVALDDFVASDYKGPAPVERQRRRVVQDVKTSGEGRLQVGKTYGGKGVFDD